MYARQVTDIMLVICWPEQAHIVFYETDSIEKSGSIFFPHTKAAISLTRIDNSSTGGVRQSNADLHKN